MTDPIPVGEDDLQAHVDGRLSLERSAVVAAYLAGHPEVSVRLAEYTEQRDALRISLQSKYEEPIPAGLRMAHIAALRRRRHGMLLSRSAAAMLLLLIGGLAGWYGNQMTVGAQSSPMRMLTADAVAAYRTFTVEVRHPVEVRADDEEYLIQWLSNRLDRPIIVPDLAKQGFRLMGGRVLPAGGGPAAQIMYDDDHGTRLTIYLQPMALDLTEFRYTESDGVRTFYRAEHGLAFAVTASTDRERLLSVARAVYDQLGGVNKFEPVTG